MGVKNASADLIAEGAPGVKGLVGDAIQITPGYEAAIAAVLGTRAEGVLVDTIEDGFALAERVRDADRGVVDFVIGDVAGPGEDLSGFGSLRPAVDVVTGPAGVGALLTRVLIADDLDAVRASAATIVADPRTITVVTRAGEVFTGSSLRAGAGASRSRLELLAERDAAADRRDELAVVADSLREALADARTEAEDAKRRTSAALTRLREHDAAVAAHAEYVNRATVQVEAASAECERLAAGLAQAQTARDEAAAAAASAQTQLHHALEAPRPILDASARDGLLEALEGAREHEMRARLEVETLRERVRAGQARVQQLERQREREAAAAAEAARRAVIRRRQRQVAADVAATLPAVLDSVDRSVAAARLELAEAESARSAVTSELSAVRADEAAVRERLAGLTESVHGLELQMHEKRLHVTSILERARSELSLDEDILISEYGPDQPIPAGEDEESSVFDRPGQRKRLQDAERKLAQLGRVNPLALEEFAALEQRHTFLTEQLADLTSTRKDLVTIIDDLDERMQTIFLAAFDDTRTAFDEVFPILFPGGSGSLSLTDPDNPLTTGIEVAVRPVGKKIERLSLLSGGERSLAAVALLTAIFKARPSPFYILDEVEAALDDANLGRLLGVFEQLRASSQLIVITHQKRTMEIADALYGVSMRQDGVSAVVGQRIADRAAS